MISLCALVTLRYAAYYWVPLTIRPPSSYGTEYEEFFTHKVCAKSMDRSKRDCDRARRRKTVDEVVPWAYGSDRDPIYELEERSVVVMAPVTLAPPPITVGSSVAPVSLDTDPLTRRRIVRRHRCWFNCCILVSLMMMMMILVLGLCNNSDCIRRPCRSPAAASPPSSQPSTLVLRGFQRRGRRLIEWN